MTTYLQTDKCRWPTTANNCRKIKILFAYDACWILKNQAEDNCHLKLTMILMQSFKTQKSNVWMHQIWYYLLSTNIFRTFSHRHGRWFDDATSPNPLPPGFLFGVYPKHFFLYMRGCFAITITLLKIIIIRIIYAIHKNYYRDSAKIRIGELSYSSLITSC